MPVTIKNAEGIELMRIAGQILGRVHNEVAKELKAGMTTWDIDHLAEDLIRSYGCTPSFLNYQGFPASVCVSVNDEVVHGIPSKKQILRDGDIISIDCGVILDGFHGDAARTIPVGEVSPEVQQLVRVTKECFFKGLEQAVVGNHISDISRAVEAHANEYGYGIVRELVGHGIGSNMHEAPEVPNYTNPRFGRGARLVPGMAIAVEPMINLGTRRVDFLSDGWTCVTLDRKPSAHYENTIFITENGPEILTNPI